MARPYTRSSHPQCGEFFLSQGPPCTGGEGFVERNRADRAARCSALTPAPYTPNIRLIWW